MSKEFDYIIIGGGLAGLQLALAFHKDDFFSNKRIAIIEPSSKKSNDKTWCFWEKGPGKWDSLITKRWTKANFFSSEGKLELALLPYTYKMLRSIDFYDFAQAELRKTTQFEFIEDLIIDIDEKNSIAIGEKDTYFVTHFFDSRVSNEYLEDNASTKIFQHFKGWMIETPSSQFNPSEFTMMDYRGKYKDTTSFIYVLPISETKALVESTFFTPFLTEDKIYDEMLKKYLEKNLQLSEYKILETEKGIIPMTDFPFHKHSNSKVTKIGTAGSWVKASTGYSFKHTEKKISLMLQNIKLGKRPSYKLLKKRSRWYDAIFLDVLFNNNEMGEELFAKFYRKNSIEHIFEYLDEETSLREELKIMWSLYHPEFIRSFFRKTF
ncbi:lycopene cyclase family protein [Gillisia sp. M10.2A]|uniref:Lycopene cyclase family protein n=1 Tax=Gillisia lutea TaxID=2909668 RepID=A0ABS9EJY6_9FLAO|nr:lycopene cyclase family protein [Gillisia lutea]MCF4102489.1 lycopene cyclase family protein [Gillisia lutea]